MLAYEIGPDLYWTGNVMEVGPMEGVPRRYTRAVFPTLKAGEYALWQQRAWTVTTVAPSPLYVPDPVLTRRQGMSAHKRALNRALSELPVSSSPTLSLTYPTAGSLLEAVDSHDGSLDYYHTLRVARRDVVEYMRLHSDAVAFQEMLGFTEEQMDDLFVTAMRFENRVA